MQLSFKYLINLSILPFFIAYAYGNGNNLIQDNKIAYELAVLAADSYLNYTFTPGANQRTCSENGQILCAILTKLSAITRSFSKPERNDLVELSRNAQLTFRDFDMSGHERLRKSFITKLINILQATLPLLEGNDATACRSLIQQLSKRLGM
jgi:hypothetical protein